VDFIRWRPPRELTGGNALFQGFAEHVLPWEPRIIGAGARDYFRIAVRRHPDADLWSWALEWNANLRLVGFFGDRAAAQQSADEIPVLDVKTVRSSPDGGFAFRADVPLADEEDCLFSVLDDHAPAVDHDAEVT